MIDQDHIAKDAAGKAAANYVQDGMIVGLGTGSTSNYFIAHLIERCKKGLHIRAVATSSHSLQLALKGGIPMLSIDEVETIDLTVDGADQIDPKKQMIKGAGGALLREKIIASISKEVIVVVDDRKVVSKLGGIPLPIEVTPFGYKATERRLSMLGSSGSFRMTSHQTLYITENQNYIFNLNLPESFDPIDLNQKIKNIPGVIETGFFLNITPSIRVIIGQTDGKIHSD
jgi:ribose 5-phosphate isomerase A